MEERHHGDDGSNKGESISSRLVFQAHATFRISINASPKLKRLWKHWMLNTRPGNEKSTANYRKSEIPLSNSTAARTSLRTFRSTLRGGREISPHHQIDSQLHLFWFRYVHQRREQRQRECEAQLEDSNVEIKKLERLVEEARERIAKIEKEINESGSTLSNLRDNIRLRRIAKQIQETQTEMDSYDIDEAARAKRNFSDQWKAKQDVEERLQQKVGPCSSLPRCPFILFAVLAYRRWN